jgi:hypothetical protein
MRSPEGTDAGDSYDANPHANRRARHQMRGKAAQMEGSIMACSHQ